MKPTRHTLAVFLDLSKAFDRVWKNKLLMKCYSDFNIRGRALPWISDFMNNRSFRVRFKNSLSGIYKTFQGIPQGSVLSPILFSLFMAGIEKAAPPCQIAIYADDVVLWDHDTDLTKLENSLDDTLSKMQCFAEEHKLNFNTSKSLSCLFTTNRHLFNYQPKVYLKEQLLESTRTPTYLGFTLDTEINCSKHIHRLCEKGSKRLQLLKYISGRDWGADAKTLKITYTTLIRPVLEYGYQIYQIAAASNLKKLERVQLSAARIITGLRHCCPNDIVLYEADLKPLSLRRMVNCAKYIASLKSFGPYNRTSTFLSDWTNNQRLKKDSPLGFMWKQALGDIEVEPCFPFNLLTPTTTLSNVTFNEDLKMNFTKQNEHPELLRQISLEVINSIPSRALVFYTDGSRSDTGRTGSGVLMKTSTEEHRYSFRNPDHSSVFRSELVAIKEALDLALDADEDDIWILTDSKSSIQYLKNWPNILDKLGQDVILKLAALNQGRTVCFQWIPSHVGVYGNEVADLLAGRGSELPTSPSAKLKTSEIHSLFLARINTTWRTPPEHAWYAAECPGLSLQCTSPRLVQATLSRLRSGHIKSLTFNGNEKTYAVCRCSAVASPSHILDCIGASVRQLLNEGEEVFKLILRHGLLDLV